MEREYTVAIVKSRSNSFGEWRYILSQIQNIRRVEIKVAAVLRDVQLSKELASEFYAEHRGKEYFDGLIDSVTSSPVTMFLLTGMDVITSWRKMMGDTDPTKAKNGTIRAVYGKELPDNAVHGSDSPMSAYREARLFFSEDLLSALVGVKPDDLHAGQDIVCHDNPDIRYPVIMSGNNTPYICRRQKLIPIDSIAERMTVCPSKEDPIAINSDIVDKKAGNLTYVRFNKDRTKVSVIPIEDPYKVAYTFVDTPDGAEEIECDMLVPIMSIQTRHASGHPMLFKPSLDEVVMALEKYEPFNDMDLLFSTEGCEISRDQSGHVARTTFYMRKGEGDGSIKTQFEIDPESFEDFMKDLESPSTPNPALIELFSRKSVLEN